MASARGDRGKFSGRRMGRSLLSEPGSLALLAGLFSITLFFLSGALSLRAQVAAAASCLLTAGGWLWLLSLPGPPTSGAPPFDRGPVTLLLGLAGLVSSWLFLAGRREPLWLWGHLLLLFTASGVFLLLGWPLFAGLTAAIGGLTNASTARLLRRQRLGPPLAAPLERGVRGMASLAAAALLAVLFITTEHARLLRLDEANDRAPRTPPRLHAPERPVLAFALTGLIAGSWILGRQARRLGKRAN